MASSALSERCRDESAAVNGEGEFAFGREEARESDYEKLVRAISLTK